jgi:hypothetical protein
MKILETVKDPVKLENKKAATCCNCLIFMWAQRGTIPRPPDYESGALTS